VTSHATVPAVSLDAALSGELETLRQHGLHRVLRATTQRNGAEVCLSDGRIAVDFASNDYLGLASDPRVAAAARHALASDATGAASARLVTGNHAHHEALERELADFKHVDAALLFPTGYMANVGAIPALVGRDDVIYSDALNHASLIDGCRLARATVRVVPHADLDALDEALARDSGAFRRRLIVADAVFSMDGELYPLDRLVEVAHSHDAWTYVDDAHGTGVLGEHGRGAAEHFGVDGEIDVLMGTLGKALGTAGAFVGGSRTLVDFLVNRARAFVYTTGSPPALAAAAREALRIARTESWRRQRLESHARRLRAGLGEVTASMDGATEHSISHATSPAIPASEQREQCAHITCVVIGDPRETLRIGAALRERGYLVGAIRPPTVPDGTSRLRITVSAAHTDAHIDGLLEALNDVMRQRATSRTLVQDVDARRSSTTHDVVRDVDRRRVWHPYTQHALSPDTVPIARAEGAYLYRDDGRPILDMISSWWVTLHGHAHPAIANAIAAQSRQLEQVIFAGFTHEPAARLAEELCAVLPRGLERVFYSDDGSTAVEVALKMALQFWRNRGEDRRLVAALDNAYHGDTFGAMSVSARGTFTAPFAGHLFDVARLPDPSSGPSSASGSAAAAVWEDGRVNGIPNASRESGDAFLRALRTLLDTRGTELAAVIVEPLLLGAGGMRMWDARTLAAVRALTAERGILLIADEVLTGFGRTGPHFACDAAGITPDIICLSKGLTGGFLPLGVTATRDEIFQSFLADDRRRTFFHGHSFTANPIACAAARASLALLDDECASRRAMIERTHRAHLARLASHPAVQRPRVLGTVAAFDLGTAHEGAPADARGGTGYLDPVGTRLAAFSLERGVLLRPLGNVVYLLPPYCVSEDELAAAYEVIAQFLEHSC
jgi:adenosylmethionine-8-amino-7-oxononanoate transaminase/8-amino-7-oxononanoate synthase